MKIHVVIRIPLGPRGLRGLPAGVEPALPEGVLRDGAYECVIPRHSPALRSLLDVLEAEAVPHLIEEVRRFRPRELTAAEALRLAPRVTVQRFAARSGESPFSGGCPLCERGSEQVAEIVVDPDEARPAGLSLTTTGQLLVNETVARAMVAGGISGCLLRATRDGQGASPDVFQVLPTHTLPPLVSPPTRVEEQEASACHLCGEPVREVSSLLYCDVESSGILDLNVTAEVFLSAGTLRPEIVISQRLWRLLDECGVTRVAVEPVVLL